MCERGEVITVMIDSEAVPIDACIAGLMEALQAIGTTSSCCGHGEGPGRIVLKDGRQLFVLPANMNWSRVGWRDLWLQFKASAYQALWHWGLLPEFQTNYDLAWPMRIAEVRRG